MKKYLPLFILFLTSSLCAQDYLGIKGGGNVSNTPLRIQLDSATIIDQEQLSFFLIGTDFEKVINKNFTLLHSIELSKEGSILQQRKDDGSTLFYSANELRYLKISVLPKLNFKLGEYGFFAALGPSVSYALDAISKTHDEDSFEVVTEKIEFEEADLVRYDYGLLGTTGIEKIVANKVKLKLGLAYYLGLKNISLLQDQDIFNESISVYFGAGIPLGKE